MPLQHSIGVAMANNETDFFLTKGQLLPIKSKKLTHKTVGAIAPNNPNAELGFLSLKERIAGPIEIEQLGLS